MRSAGLSAGAYARLAAQATLIHVAGPQGLRVAWRRWPSRTPSQRAIVLLHGSFGSWTHWAALVMRLRRRLHVIAPDLPGFGDSDEAPEARAPSDIAERLANDLPRVAPDVCSFVIGGFSLGAVHAGWLACALAARGIAMDGLLLLSPGGLGVRTRSRVRLQSIDPGASLAARGKVHRHNLAALMFGDANKIDALAVRLQAGNVARARWRGRFTERLDLLLDALRRLSLGPCAALPLLAIWGARDAFDDDVNVRVNALRHAWPGASTVVIPAAGHWVGYEAVAEVASRVETWLSPIVQIVE